LLAKPGDETLGRLPPLQDQGHERGRKWYEHVSLRLTPRLDLPSELNGRHEPLCEPRRQFRERELFKVALRAQRQVLEVLAHVRRRPRIDANRSGVPHQLRLRTEVDPLLVRKVAYDLKLVRRAEALP